MKIWVTSDFHLGHKSIIKYCGRPSGFENLIIKSLDEIDDNDFLIHLGDFCIGNDDMWHNEIIKLDCRNVLVRGNHDHKSNAWYMKHGWDFVCDRFTWNTHGNIIVFSHQPVKIEDNEINIHGHFHNQLPRLLKKDWAIASEEERNKDDLSVLTDRHILISSELLNYKPILLDKLIHERIRDIKNNVQETEAEDV